MIRLLLRTALLGLAVTAVVATAAGPASSRHELRVSQAAPPKAAAFSPADLAFYDKQVKPILTAHCLKCHGDKKPRGGLRLTSREAILKGGDLGPAVVLDKAETSHLVQAVNYKEGLEMPPTGRLVDRDIGILTQWVQKGLPMPAVSPVVENPPEEGGKVTPEAKNFWAYRPVARPAAPTVKQAGWASNPIDAFVLARLEEKGLAPAPAADRVALIRRMTYDLTGLPPTPDQVDAFVKDTDPKAYENLVDALLKSPAYGEKWGRHWLDLVRYAESHGYERDSFKPFAWRYRDYVIRSFNDDKPYDRFLQEQLAGDEVDEVTAETLTATGYYRLGIWDDEPADRLLAKYDVLDGVVSTTASVVMGMSVGCARCHDHKKDPLPQADYYRLLAFFHDVTDMNGRNTRPVATEADKRAAEQRKKARQEREGKLYGQIYALEQRAALAAAGKGLVTAQASDLEDLTFKFYRDTWERLPDFDAIKVEESGPVASQKVSLAPASREEAIGLVFAGKLKVPAPGTYTFHLESADGVRLTVNGKTVFDKTTRGTHRTEAKIELPASPASFRLDYFNSYGKPVLKLAWSGVGFEKRDLSEEAGGERVLLPDSRQAGQTWHYTTAKPAEGWFQPDFDAKTWKKGPGGFGAPGTPGAVVRTPWTGQNIWLRKTFTLDKLPTALALDLHHDDDAEVYLNGTLVHRVSGYTVAYRRVRLDEAARKLLRVGENTLAVHCTQKFGGQYIDVGLVQGPPLTPAELMAKHGADLIGAGEVKRHAELTQALEASRKEKLPEPGLEVMRVEERGQNPTHVLIRGNPSARGARVEPGFPQVLTDAAPKITPRGPDKSSGKRRALAEWLTRKDNPVTARVMVNRVWQFHFGRGIVPSANDFGKLGEMPSHPELLDWLADEFTAGGWRLKALHKTILLSSTYQQAARATEAGLKADPANVLLGHFPMRRLTAEEVRDSILAVSGALNRKVGGPGVYPPIPREVLAGQSVPGAGWNTSGPEESARRSVYVHVKRSLQLPILATHDQADTDNSCAVRYTTTVPTQSLGMLNGQFTNEQAVLLADRLRREAPDDLEAQVRRAIRLTTSRSPGAEEVKKDVAFVRELKKQGGLSDNRALELYALLALNANEFVYLD